MPTFRLPNRSRAARLLASLLVPFVFGAAFAGLVVCAGPGGFSLSAGSKPTCPRKALKTLATLAPTGDEAPAISACTVLPALGDAALETPAPAPDLGGRTAMLPASTWRPVGGRHAAPGTPRAPPVGASHLDNSVVLRM